MTIIEIVYAKPGNRLPILKERQGNEIIKWLKNKIYEGRLKKMGNDEEKAEGIRSKIGVCYYFLPTPGQNFDVPLPILWGTPGNLSKPCFLSPFYASSIWCPSSLSPPFLHTWFVSYYPTLSLIVLRICVVFWVSTLLIRSIYDNHW